MLTLRAAAGLLRAASTADELLPIAAAIGFDPSPTRLDDEARSAFGLDSSFGEVRLLRGPGARRAITFVAELFRSRHQDFPDWESCSIQVLGADQSYVFATSIPTAAVMERDRLRLHGFRSN